MKLYHFPVSDWVVIVIGELSAIGVPPKGRFASLFSKITALISPG